MYLVVISVIHADMSGKKKKQKKQRSLKSQPIIKKMARISQTKAKQLMSVNLWWWISLRRFE